MKTRRLSPAFTMIELLVVVALIGVIFAFVAPRIARYIGKAGQAEIKFKFAGVKEALQEYRLEFGAYPSTKEGLRALVQNPRPNDDRYRSWKPFLKEDAIADKAGNEFEYHCPPERFKGKYSQFELIYLGPTQSEDDPDRLDDGI